MRRIHKIDTVFWSIIGILVLMTSCKNEKTTPDSGYAKVELSNIATSQETPSKKTESFNEYWYAGKAEITSYQLEQIRYGEARQGHAVLVYVTEPFLENKQVKADYDNETNISVLKLNSMKKFNTGIYPYSIMQSTFYPIANNQHAIKVSCSVQEWCGHVYTQINNRDRFDVTSHSYFESEGDQNSSLEKTYLENEIWTQLRIDPNTLPVDSLDIVPSLEFIRLKHKELKAYKATATLKKGNYTISFPDLKRTLSINFSPEFPYAIESWEETTNGLTTKATKLKAIKSDYWNKNENKDEFLRKTLQLK